jgi:hypothetical protein
MSAATPHWKVQIYLYDLSMGMAKSMSPMFLGKQIDGIWHSGVVVYGTEYYYGGGIQAGTPGVMPGGIRPVQVIDIGYTAKTQQQFHEWLESVSHKYQPETYNILKHNWYQRTPDTQNIVALCWTHKY